MKPTTYQQISFHSILITQYTNWLTWDATNEEPLIWSKMAVHMKNELLVIFYQSTTKTSHIGLKGLNNISKVQFVINLYYNISGL